MYCGIIFCKQYSVVICSRISAVLRVRRLCRVKVVGDGAEERCGEYTVRIHGDLWRIHLL
jgi:hypothetical protein